MTMANAEEPGISPVISNGAGGNDSGPITSVRESTESASGGGYSPFIFFFILWLVLLVLFIATAVLVVCSRRNQQQQQVVNVEEPVPVATIDDQKEENDEAPRINRHAAFTQRSGMVLLHIGAIVSMVLSIVSITSCKFLELAEPMNISVSYEEYRSSTAEVYSIGLWSIETLLSFNNEKACMETGPFVLDWQFHLARASAVIASLVGGLSLLILFICAAKPNYRKFLRFLVWPFLAAAIFQSLTLVLFGTTYCDNIGNCEANTGAVSSITAALYWAFCACATAMIPFRA